MNLLGYADSDEMTQGLRALHEGFMDQGSPVPALAAVLIILAAVPVMVWISRLHRRANGELIPNDPKLLFQSLLRRLELSDAQRHWLESVAKELRLRHPAVILLGSTSFDRAAQEWRRRTNDASPQESALQDARITDIRVALFSTEPYAAK